MKQIPLRNYLKEIIAYALVSDEDYDYFNERKWHLSHFGYAVSTVTKSKYISMHRSVYERAFGLPFPQNIDHKDRNKLNNQRENIRAATDRENAYNKSIYFNSETGYHAVRKDLRTGRFQAFCYENGRWCSIGYFFTAREAAIARDLKLKEIAPIEFVVFNCPDATEAEISSVLNQLRSAKKRRGKSRYRGVILFDYDCRAKSWLARIKVNGKNHCLGYYATEKEAAIAYNEAASKLLGEKAMLNNLSED
jgi:hypothetical protein